jgi:hypothetical protein
MRSRARGEWVRPRRRWPERKGDGDDRQLAVACSAAHEQAAEPHPSSHSPPTTPKGLQIGTGHANLGRAVMVAHVWGLICGIRFTDVKGACIRRATIRENYAYASDHSPDLQRCGSPAAKCGLGVHVRQTRTRRRNALSSGLAALSGHERRPGTLNPLRSPGAIDPQGLEQAAQGRSSTL